MKPLLIKCPCCGVEIDIDRATGEIVRTGPKQGEKQGVERFDEITYGVKQKSKKTASAFDEVTAKVKGRERELDDVFKQAVRKVKETDDGSRPENPLDF